MSTRSQRCISPGACREIVNFFGGSNDDPDVITAIKAFLYTQRNHKGESWVVRWDDGTADERWYTWLGKKLQPSRRFKGSEIAARNEALEKFRSLFPTTMSVHDHPAEFEIFALGDQEIEKNKITSVQDFAKGAHDVWSPRKMAIAQVCPDLLIQSRRWTRGSPCQSGVLCFESV